MIFKDRSDARQYAREKYTVTAADVFGLLCDGHDHNVFWEALAHGVGFGSNSPNMSMTAELPELYDDFDTPVEAYGYVLFWLDFDVDFEFEERMPLSDFIDYLKDANAVACQMYPEDAPKLRAYLERAIAEVTQLQKAHEAWKRKNGAASV